MTRTMESAIQESIINRTETIAGRFKFKTFNGGKNGLYIIGYIDGGGHYNNETGKYVSNYTNIIKYGITKHKIESYTGYYDNKAASMASMFESIIDSSRKNSYYVGMFGLIESSNYRKKSHKYVKAINRDGTISKYWYSTRKFRHGKYVVFNVSEKTETNKLKIVKSKTIARNLIFFLCDGKYTLYRYSGLRRPIKIDGTVISNKKMTDLITINEFSEQL
jgi:hypothetical protein